MAFPLLEEEETYSADIWKEKHPILGTPAFVERAIHYTAIDTHSAVLATALPVFSLGEA